MKAAYQRFDQSFPKILAVTQHRPHQPCLRRGKGNYRLPAAVSFNQIARPVAEAILLVAKAAESGSGSHDQATAEVVVTSPGAAPQSGVATAAVLPRNPSDPCGKLATVVEFVRAAEAGEPCAGGGRAKAGKRLRRLLRASSRAAWAMALSPGYRKTGRYGDIQPLKA